MSDLTATQHEEIRARAGAALKGPWWAQGETIYGNETAPPEWATGDASEPHATDEMLNEYEDWLNASWHVSPHEVENRATAVFIAHARTDVDLLLGEVDRLTQENERQREVMQDVGDLLDGFTLTDDPYWSRIRRSRKILTEALAARVSGVSPNPKDNNDA